MREQLLMHRNRLKNGVTLDKSGDSRRFTYILSECNSIEFLDIL